MLTTTDGTVHHLFVENAIGSLGRPMTDAELDAKLTDLCDPVLGAAGSARLIVTARALVTRRRVQRRGGGYSGAVRPRQSSLLSTQSDRDNPVRRDKG